MSSTQNQLKAHSYAIQDDRAVGLLRIGNKKLSVSVTEFSWAGYTVCCPASTESQLRLGLRGTFEFKGDTFRVTCLSRQLLDDGRLELELERSDAIPALKQKKQHGGESGIKLNHSDPVLVFGSLAGLIFLLLILPGWGGGWGTSRYLTEGVASAATSVCDAFRSLLMGQ